MGEIRETAKLTNIADTFTAGRGKKARKAKSMRSWPQKSAS